MKSKLIKLTIDRYITEKSESIIYNMHNYKRILIISEMSTGKTHLITNDITKDAEKQGYNTLAIEPVKLLIEQVKERVGDSWGLYYGDKKDDISKFNKMIATVDSSLKISEMWAIQEKPFIVTVDEAHEEEFSQGYREAFKNIGKILENPFCKGVVYFTATGEDLKEEFSHKFDKIIEIRKADTITDKAGKEIPNPYKKPFAAKTFIHIGNWTPQNIYTLRNQIRNRTDNIISTKWDSIDGIRGLEINNKKHSEKAGIKNEFYTVSTKKIKYLTDKENEIARAKEEALRDDLRKYKRITGNTDLSATSVMHSGIEVNNDPNTILLNVIDNNYVEANVIQLLGRYRNGVQEYHLLIQEPTEKQLEKPLRNTKDIYKDLLLIANEKIKYLNTVMEKAPHLKEKHIQDAKSTAGIEIIEKDNNVTFKVNEIVLKAEAIAENQRQYLDHVEALKKRLERRYGHILGNIEIIYSDITKEDYNKEFKDALQEDKNKVKEKTKELKEVFKEKLPLHFDNLEKILDSSQYGYLTDEEKQVKDIVSSIKQFNPNITKLEKKFKSIEIPSYLFWSYWSRLEEKELRNVLSAGTKIYYNRIFTESEETRKALVRLAYNTRKSQKNLLRQVKTLEYFDKKGIKHGDYITKAIYKDLINTYSNIGIKFYIDNLKIVNDTTAEKQAKEKALDKLVEDTNKYLGLIFKTTTRFIRNREYVVFSSIRLDIDDLI